MKRSGQHGYVLLLVSGMLLVVALLAVLLTQQAPANLRVLQAETRELDARFAAEAGLSHARWLTAGAACIAPADTGDVAFGTHTYSASITSNGTGTVTTSTVTASADAVLSKNLPAIPDGSGASLEVRPSGGAEQRALLRFDLGSISSSATVFNATLRLHVSNPDNILSQGLHLVTSDWTEATATWDTHADAAGATAVALLPGIPANGASIEVDVTPIVRGWISGGLDNFGFMLIGQASGDYASYGSREAAASAEQPQLTVRWSASGTRATRATLDITGTAADGTTYALTRTDTPVLNTPPHDAVVHPDVRHTADAWLDGASAALGYGGNPELRTSESTGPQRALLQFDIERYVPAGAILTYAALRLHATVAGGTTAVHAVTAPWTEGSCDGATCTDGVTWTTYDGQNNWSTAGGDTDADPVVSVAVPTVDESYDFEVTDLAQAWLDGTRDNYGVQLRTTGAAVRFASADNADPKNAPRLVVEYQCACDSVCLPPAGSGNLLLVVSDAASPTAAESLLAARFAAWGYTVSLLSDHDSAADFTSAIDGQDVVYVPASASADDIESKLTLADVGVVWENASFNDEMLISAGSTATVSASLAPASAAHPISAPFPSATLTVGSGASMLSAASGALAAGTVELAAIASQPALLATESGATLIGGGTAPARRVALPLGGDTALTWSLLNNNGHVLVARALDWAANGATVAPGVPLLLVVPDPSSLSTREEALSTLLTSWGYAVTTIDDDDSQASFDTALATQDVVLVSSAASDGSIDEKLTATTLGVVSEVPATADFLRVNDNSSDQTANSISVSGTSHYITEPFSGFLLTLASSSFQVSTYDGTSAPHAESLATLGGQPSLLTLESGAIGLNDTRSAGRRVMLPWGDVVIDDLTADGQTLLQRALEWAGGAGDAPPILNALAHWEFNESSGTVAVDSVGTHDATLTGGTWTTGTVDGGLRLDGSSNHATVTDDDALDLDTAFTVMGWINLDAVSNYQMIMSKGDSYGQDNYYLGTRNDEVNFGYYVSSYHEFETSGANLETDTWYHLAASFDDQAGVVRVFLNGAEALNAAIPAQPLTNTGVLYLGTNRFGEFLGGILDDVRIFDYALTAGEVAAYSALGTPVATTCTDTFADDFESYDYAGDTGTRNWRGDWFEINESGDPGSGDEQVGSLSGNAVARVRDNDGGGEGIGRQLDLGDYTSAHLSFEYWREGLDDTGDHVRVEYSDDEMANWTELARIEGPGTDAVGSPRTVVALPLGGAMADKAAIRFVTSAGMGGADVVYLDNIEICAQ